MSNIGDVVESSFLMTTVQKLRIFEQKNMGDLTIIQVHFLSSILQEIREECLAIFRLNGTGISSSIL